MSARRLDIVLYGASGYTGEFIAEELLRHSDLSKCRFGFAGRTMSKVSAVLDRVVRKTNASTDRVELMVASNDDPASLLAMAKAAKLVINATGPYRFLGEAVVKACAEAGTDYIDISGEPEFLEKCVVSFDTLARENGAVIVGACGWDSIPSDMGVAKLCSTVEATNRKVGSVEGYLEMHAPAGASAHTTTYECAVYGVANASALPRIRKQLDPSRFPMEAPPKRLGSAPFAKTDAFPGSRFITGFPGSDMSVVKRSQRAIAQSKGVSKGVGYAMYVLVGWVGMIKLTLGGLFFNTLVRFSFGRSLLLKYPSFFTFGVFSTKGPNAEQLEKTWGRLLLRAYAPKDADAAGAFGGAGAGVGDAATVSRGGGGAKGRDGRVMVGEGSVTFPEPGYVATSRIAVAAAATLLLDRESVIATLERKGGVVTTAEAFRETKLVDRLTERGITFEMRAVE